MNLRFSSFSFKVGKKYEMNAFFHLFWHLGQIQKRRMGHNLELSHKNARWMSALHSGQVSPESGIQICAKKVSSLTLNHRILHQFNAKAP